MGSNLPKISLSGFVVLLFSFWNIDLIAQECLPEGMVFSTQAQIDAFAAEYPGCTTILGDVVIEEDVPGTITNLKGLSVLHTFGDYLEIHDNDALLDLSGLDNVESIAGGLNIYGNPRLEKLTGLEKVTQITGSLRIALNHKLRSITALSGLERVVEDVTIADNFRLPNLYGLETLDTIGGYLLVIMSPELINLRGLDNLRQIGKGLLVESNARLRDLHGLDQLTSIGGNCIVVNNPDLRTLDGLNAVTSINGKLQIALNPFLETVAALRKLKKIKGLLQIYANVGLKSLSGLENIDETGIEDLAILSSDVLSICNVKSICNYLKNADNQAAISMNANGCNVRSQIVERCQRKGPSGQPSIPSDPVFFPNPTSGLVTVEADDLESGFYEVSGALGRVLLTGELSNRQLDLSELPAGMYFVKIKTEERELLAKIIKLN